jgi:hypothetical protein
MLLLLLPLLLLLLRRTCNVVMQSTAQPRPPILALTSRCGHWWQRSQRGQR